MFNDKGQIRIIEAFLAITVIFSVLLVSVTFPSFPDLDRQKYLADLGTQALLKLDSNGTLGSLIMHENWTAIKSSLDILLPLGVSFNCTVYDENMQPLNSQAIQNSNLQGGETVAVQYTCATQNAIVKFFVLRLQLAWTR
mgnify:CR=1 FL=1